MVHRKICVNIIYYKNDGYSKVIVLKENISIKKEVENLPLQISIELTKLNMPLNELLKLQPGNILELGISMDSPVNLIINNKKILTAELIQISEENVGLRIIDLA